jgi:hypothetical protein
MRAILAEYQAHYSTARPHQGIAQHVPDSDHRIPPPPWPGPTSHGSTEEPSWPG